MQFEIGDICVEVRNTEDISSGALKAYDAFRTQGESDFVLRLRRESCPVFSHYRDIFDSGGLWSLAFSERRYVLSCFSEDFGSRPYKAVVFDQDFGGGELFLDPDAASLRLLDNPLAFPLDEVLFVQLLARNRGLLIHASGLGDEGAGMIFAGSSGAGKSTIARLFIEKNKSHLLNDDRLVIRPIQNGFSVYGTPWAGEIKEYSSGHASLTNIFFLKQSSRNRINEISSVEAVSRLLSVTFAPFWNTTGMGFILDFCNRIAQSVPIAELEFRNDESIVDFISAVTDAVS